MPASRWKSIGTIEADEQYLVFASSIPTKRVRSAWKMFKGSRVVRKQLAATDGVVGFSLLARPFRNEYATLSVWTGEAALATFASASPHAELMRELSPELASTKFERWFIEGIDGPPQWTEALQRLA